MRWLPQLPRWNRLLALTCATAMTCATLMTSGCATRRAAKSGPAEPAQAPSEVLTLKTTAYCDCEICCNWEQTHWDKTIVARGPNRGMPTTVGVGVTGKQRGPGTIAADPSVFSFGTTVSIPGYGVGVVSDSAADLGENQIDLWFKNHELVEQWGEQVHPVKVWR